MTRRLITNHQRYRPKKKSSPQFQTFFAARPDGASGFLQRNLSDYEADKLPYIIEITDYNHAVYRINDDPAVQQQALDSAYYVLVEACTYHGQLPTQRNMKITNVNDGVLQLINDEWTIVKRLEIKFDPAY